MPLLSLSAAQRRHAGGGRPASLGLRGWAWRLTLGLLLAAFGLALGLWLTLHWLILPRLDEWRPRVEVLAARALGHPVQIGRIVVRSSGWVPAFTLHDVLLRDGAGREALRLPQVSAALSVPSLLALRLRFDQLLIEGAQLEVRRDAQGRWFVGGLAMTPDASALDASAGADWFFEQHEMLIRGGTLRWVDEQRAAPPLALRDVQLLVRNRGRRHELRLDATPPADWGERFSIVGQARGALLSRAGDWQRWKGTLHAHLPRADVAQLRRHVDLPVDVQQGRAALRAWVDWDQGAPQAMTLDAVLRDVQVRLGTALAPLALADLNGRIVAERRADGIRLAIQGLGFTTPEGAVWAPSQMALQWQRAPDAAPPATGAASITPAASAAAPTPPLAATGGDFTADRLDLATLAALAERLPIGSGLRELLRQLEPEGTVSGLQARWEGPLDHPRRYSAQAAVKGLSIAAAASPEPGGIGRPGWRGADLQISASETGGQADLAMADGQITLPGVFDEPVVPLVNFNAQLQWRIDAAAAARSARPAIELKVVNARFDNADARGALNATWHTGAGAGFGKGGRLPGVLLLDGTLAEGRASQVARYLPLGVTAPKRQWVQAALLAGEVRDVTYHVKGDLWDFPFVNKRDGEFRIAGKLQGVTLAPVPSVPPGGAEPAWESPWPALAQVSGEVVFERNSMSFQQAQGKLFGLALADVQGRIRELSEHAVLEVDGQVRGPAGDLLRLVRSTPLADWTGHALDATTATGVADLKLGLNIPLGRTADAVLKASLQLAGNDVRLRPDLPPLAAARGRVDISHKGFLLAGVRAQVLGGEAQIDGGSQADGSLRFAANGTASAEGLRRAGELGLLPRLAQKLQGQAAYRLQLGLGPNGADWQLASNLQGLAIDLPAPLGKAADAVLALRASGQPEARAAGASSGPGRDWWRLELGPLKAIALVEPGASGPRPLRSAWAWDAPLPEPVAGGRAVLALRRLDLAPWLAVAGGPALALPPPHIGTPTGTPTGTPGAAPAPADSAWLPHSVQLKTPELLAGGRRLDHVTLELQRLATGAGAGDDGWRAQLQANQAAGTLEYREPRAPAAAGAPGRVRARLARLSLPPAESDSAADGLLQWLDGAGGGVPALDIEVEDFELRGLKLGKLAVEAVNRLQADDRAGRSEWRVNQLSLINADATLLAKGAWQAVAGTARRRMVLSYELELRNGGALLERLGFGRVLRGAKGKLTGDLGWDGSPLALHVPSLGGRLQMSISQGQFLEVDPGAARLLGVLSLQALPRRLQLDFRDVFQKGFAFDTASADVLIREGVAHTQNLQLLGPQALVGMEGTADIARETQDMKMVVVPELNTASASLAYAAINPALGLGALVGQWILREPLRQASARAFHVTGRWDDPKVARVERGLLDKLPESATITPPAASSAAPGTKP